MRAPRTPDWEGAFNLFDLGGLALIGGGMTAHGRVFRSGRTESMSDRGWSELLAAGVTTVIDLRNESESGRRAGDPFVSDTFRAGVTFVHAPTEDPDDEEFQRVCGPWLDHPRSYADNLRLFPTKMATVFAALAAAPGATLIHCSGGRDRTGLVTAMLLRLAGVETAPIVEDYAEAFRAASRHVTRTAELDPEQVHERPYSYGEIEARIRERADALVDWLDGFDVASWLSRAGLSESEIEVLRSRLLVHQAG